MVTSVTSTNVASASATVSALAPRPHADDVAKRQDAANKPAAEEDSTVVQISQQAAKLAEQAVASQPAQAPAAPSKPAADAAVKTENSAASKPDAAFEPADGNKDGSVTEFEKQAYDFKHPKTLAELIAEEKAAAANGAGAGVKAYEDVARSGRTA